LAKRYFIAPDQLTAAEPQIAGEDAHHLRSVLRVRPGTLISVFDGTGMDYRAKVTAVNREGITVALIEQIAARRESLLSITVAQGFLKDKKMDTLVRQLTELGVTRWAPFLAQRSVALPTAKRLESRHRRWVKITCGAVKQCGRSRFMRIDPAVTFSRVLAAAPPAALKLLFWEDVAGAIPLQELREIRPQEVFLMIGPEGGFEPEEVEMAIASGFKLVSMGPRILRAETAAVVAGAMVQFVFGDLNQKILDNSWAV
jgi:16S rRNA (uracil1498-N3)-methyltransferase